MKHIHIVLLGFSFFILQSCCNTANENESIYANLNINNNDFIGEWYSVKRTYPFGAILKIDSNFIFTYEGGACVSRFGSNGYWVLDDDTLILNSNKSENCYYLSNFGVNCLTIKTNDSTISTRETSIKGCIPEFPNEYVIFDNEKFIIKDSVLTHIQKLKNLCSDIKDDFTRIKHIN